MSILSLFISDSSSGMHKYTRMVIQGQLAEPAVFLSDLYACEELIHSFIRQNPNNIMLTWQTFCNGYEPKILIYDI